MCIVVLIAAAMGVPPGVNAATPQVELPHGWYVVVEPFRYVEARRFERGWNRGADVLARGGIVRAVAPGRVRFAGAVAGRQVVTVATTIDGEPAVVTYTGLGGSRLAEGVRVATGDVIGTGTFLQVGAYAAERRSRYLPVVAAAAGVPGRVVTLPDLAAPSGGRRPPTISGAIAARLRAAIERPTLGSLPPAGQPRTGLARPPSRPGGRSPATGHLSLAATTPPATAAATIAVHDVSMQVGSPPERAEGAGRPRPRGRGGGRAEHHGRELRYPFPHAWRLPSSRPRTPSRPVDSRRDGVPDPAARATSAGSSQRAFVAVPAGRPRSRSSGADRTQSHAETVGVLLTAPSAAARGSLRRPVAAHGVAARGAAPLDGANGTVPHRPIDEATTMRWPGPMTSPWSILGAAGMLAAVVASLTLVRRRRRSRTGGWVGAPQRAALLLLPERPPVERRAPPLMPAEERCDPIDEGTFHGHPGYREADQIPDGWQPVEHA